MAKINIVGVGTGDKNQLTIESFELIKNSTMIIGDKRFYEFVKVNFNKSLTILTMQETIEYIGRIKKSGNITLLVSGDSGFYSLTKTLMSNFSEDVKFNILPGISSVQYFCSKINTSWDDVSFVSVHGRKSNLIGMVLNNKKTFVLTGGQDTVKKTCDTLISFGLEDLNIIVGENLSYENERIIGGNIKEIIEDDFLSLSVMMIMNERPFDKSKYPTGIKDEDFIRGQTPMTKEEVRAVSISKLQILEDDIIYDIGSGTGSVAIEMSMRANFGVVYAVEEKSDSIALIVENRNKFNVRNLKIIHELAPKGLEDLPRPNKVFIGGTKGNLNSILDLIYEKNNSARIVINALTIETLSEVSNYYKGKADYEVEFTNISISKSEKVLNYNMMKGQNPIYVILARKLI